MFECNRESSKLHYRQMYCCESIIPVGDRAMRYKQLDNLNNLYKIYDLSDLRYIVRAWLQVHVQAKIFSEID